MKITMGAPLGLSLLLVAAPAVGDPGRRERVTANTMRLDDVRKELVQDVVDAAFIAETADWSAEFLLGLAYQESRFEPAQRTGLTCGPFSVSPRDLEMNAAFCGGSKLYSRGCRERARDQCHMWSQDTTLAFQAAVVELNWWLARAGNNRGLALTGRGCGADQRGRIVGCGKGWFFENVRCTEGRIRTGRTNVCQYRRPPNRH